MLNKTRDGVCGGNAEDAPGVRVVDADGLRPVAGVAIALRCWRVSVTNSGVGGESNIVRAVERVIGRVEDKEDEDDEEEDELEVEVNDKDDDDDDDDDDDKDDDDVALDAAAAAADSVADELATCPINRLVA